MRILLAIAILLVPLQGWAQEPRELLSFDNDNATARLGEEVRVLGGSVFARGAGGAPIWMRLSPNMEGSFEPPIVFSYDSPTGVEPLFLGRGGDVVLFAASSYLHVVWDAGSWEQSSSGGDGTFPAIPPITAVQRRGIRNRLHFGGPGGVFRIALESSGEPRWADDFVNRISLDVASGPMVEVDVETTSGTTELLCWVSGVNRELRCLDGGGNSEIITGIRNVISFDMNEDTAVIAQNVRGGEHTAIWELSRWPATTWNDVRELDGDIGSFVLGDDRLVYYDDDDMNPQIVVLFEGPDGWDVERQWSPMEDADALDLSDDDRTLVGGFPELNTVRVWDLGPEPGTVDPPDAGVPDSGVPDMGVEDQGAQPDANTQDQGAEDDGGTRVPREDLSCTCRVGQRSTSQALLALLPLAFLFYRRQR